MPTATRPAVLSILALGATIALGDAACASGGPPLGHAGARAELRAADVSPAKPPPPALVFAWGVPCRVPVIQTARDSGQTSRRTYDVVLEAAEGGAELRLRFEHIELIGADGRPIATPADAADARTPGLRTEITPMLRISRNGDSLGLEDVEHMVNRLSATATGGPRVTVEAIRAAMPAPAILESVGAQMGNRWKNWVEAWVGVCLAPGETVSGSARLELGGAEVEVPTTLARLAADPAARGHVRLHAETHLRGAALARILGDILAEVVAGTGAAAPAAAMVANGDRQEIDEVEADQATLRPYRALFEVKTDLALKDGKHLMRDDRREVVFRWDRAQGACAGPR